MADTDRLKKNAVRHPPGSPGKVAGETASSAELQKALARRSWIFRTAVLLAIAAVGLSFLVTWRRDELAIASALRRLSPLTTYLQTTLDATGLLPGELPLELEELPLELFLSPADRFYASQVSDPVIVAATPLQILHLKEEGRAVVVYHQGKVTAQWMGATEFERAMNQQEKAKHAFEELRRSRPLNLP